MESEENCTFVAKINNLLFMIRCFDIPRELIYMGKGENGYEKYMADDPTGINQVLDEMYGVVFNDASAQLNFDEPGIYFDCAYEMAIRLKLQKYPHRYLKPIDVDMAIYSMVDYLLKPMGLTPSRKSDDCRLIFWLTYAIIRLQGDNSVHLQEFSDYMVDYLVDDYSNKTYLYTQSIDELLDDFILHGDVICNRNLAPQPMSVEELCSRKEFKISFRKKLCEQDVIFLLKIYRDAKSQADFYDLLISNGVTNDDADLRARIEDGEYVGNPVDEAADGFQGKLQAAKLEIENLKQMNEQQAETIRKLNEKLNKLDASGNLSGTQSANSNLRTFTFTEEEFQLLKQHSGRDFTLRVMDVGKEEGFDLELSNKMVQLFCDMGNLLSDPSEIDDVHYPGAKRMIEIMLDSKQMMEVLDVENEKELSKVLRNCDRTRKKHKEELELKKTVQQQIQLIQAGLADAKNVTIVNGNKIERSYGTNYNLEAGANVLTHEAMAAQQRVLGQQSLMDQLSQQGIQPQLQAQSLDPDIQVTPINDEFVNPYRKLRESKGGRP